MKALFFVVAVCALSASAQGSGTIFMAGGGFADPEIIRRFVELAGGPDASIVVIPTASTIADEPDVASRVGRFFEERGGATNVRVLHTRDRAEADTEKFTEALDDADAVWIWGGQARRLVDAYLDTRTVEALKSVLARDGLVGGTSSGAVVLSDLVIRPGDTESPRILKENNLDGFGLVQNLLVDVHAIMRNRLFETLAVRDEYPERVFVSIDENTAIVIKDGVFEVVGRSYVVVYGVPGRREPFLFLSAGDLFSITHNQMTAEDCSIWGGGGCIPLSEAQER